MQAPHCILKIIINFKIVFYILINVREASFHKSNHICNWICKKQPYTLRLCNNVKSGITIMQFIIMIITITTNALLMDTIIDSVLMFHWLNGMV